MSGPSASAVVGLLRSQIGFHPPIPTASFAGQTVIITGANAGLGRETVRHIVRLGASRVILAVRNFKAGEAAKDEISREYSRSGGSGGRGSCEMEVWHLDMAQFESVQAFAKKAAEELERIDVVVANAGVWPKEFEMAEGWEQTVTVNVISTFLLLRLLLPKMQETAAKTRTTPRFTVVTSTLHKFATLQARKAVKIFEELKKPIKDFDARYNDSKLLVMLYGQKLAASAGSQVCINFVCPGWCASGLKVPRAMPERAAERMLARSTDEGARVIVDAVVAEKAGERHGAFVSDLKVKMPAPWITSVEGQQTADRVWTEMNEILVEIAPSLAAAPLKDL